MERIYRVDVLNDYLIKVTFFNGDVKEVDLDKYLSPNDNMLDEDCARCREFVEEYKRINGEIPLTHGAKVSEQRNAVDFTCGMSINAETLWYCGYLVEQVYIYDIRVRLAETIVRIREHLHMTQNQLSQITGIHQAEISKLERGVGNPSVTTIEKVAAGLGCDATISFEHLSNIEFPPERVRQYLKILKRQGDYTIYDIDDLPEDARCELSDGRIYDMGMPSIVHQRIIVKMLMAFEKFIERNHGQCITLVAPFALKFDDDESTLLSPDLAVVCDRDKVNAKEVCGAPDFVLEVVSPHNAQRDYGEKTEIYRKKGVKEYWILDPIKRRLIVHLFDQDEIPTIYGFDSIVGVSIFDNNLTIDLGEIEDILSQLD